MHISASSADAFIGDSRELEIPVQSATAWHVRTYNHYTELEPIWRRMEAEGHCTVFQTYDWAACWYDTAVACGEAQPLIVLLSGEDGEPYWLLPLCIHKKKGLRIISFADLGITDYAAPVISPRSPADHFTIRAMLKDMFMALPPCDAIFFEKLAEEVDGVTNPLLNVTGLEPFPAGCHGISLSEPWPTLAGKIMQRRLRSTIRQQWKRIKYCGEISIQEHDSPETMAPLLDRLLEMRNERFKAIGRKGMPVMWQNFYRNLTSRQAPGRSLDVVIATMAVDGKTISSCFGLRKGKIFYAILPTFDMDKWEQFRPGMLLFDSMIEQFGAKVEGGYFDFTIGDEPYKERFGSDSKKLYEWMLPRSAKGFLFYLAWRAKTTLRRHPRYLKLAKDVRSWIQARVKNA